MEEGEQVGLRDLVRAKVVDSQGAEIGHLHDLAMEMDLARPSLTGVGVHLEWTDRVGEITLVRKMEDPVILLPWGSVESITESRLTLRDKHPALPAISAAGKWLLRRDVLDKQMLDSKGARLQRVDDVVLRWQEGALKVVGLEVSGGLMTSSRVKRLISKLRSQHPGGRGKNFLPWEAVERIEADDLVLGGAADE